MRPDHAHFIAHDQGVWLLKPKVFITAPQWAGSWTGREGPDHARICTTLCLRDTNSQPGANCPPEVYRKTTTHPTINTQHPHGHTAHTFIKATVQHRPNHSGLTLFPVWVGQHTTTPIPRPRRPPLGPAASKFHQW